MGTVAPIHFYTPFKMVLAPPTPHHTSAFAPAVVAIPSCSMLPLLDLYGKPNPVVVSKLFSPVQRLEYHPSCQLRERLEPSPSTEGKIS